MNYYETLIFSKKKNGKVILIRKSREYGKNYSKIKKTA